MPKSKNNPSEKKTVRGITTRVRTALENTARQLQLSADGLPIASGEKPINVIVAFSGGLDSSVLLYAVSQLKGKSYGEITAVHVHHGLSKHANEWAEPLRSRPPLPSSLPLRELHNEADALQPQNRRRPKALSLF